MQAGVSPIPSADEANQSMNSVPGNKVLFVDDEPSMREIMAILLHEDGYEVLTANDGLDALAKIRASTPDLIISDLNMRFHRSQSASRTNAATDYLQT